MHSNSPSARISEKSIRTQAVASVTQEMSSARLKVLGDLMETRKKAEAHEQEFLRAIHSENAAFSQIVSLFESNLLDIKAELSSDSNALEERLTTVSFEMGTFKENISSSLDSQVSKLASTMLSLRSALDAKLADDQCLFDSLKSKVNDASIICDKRAGSLRSEIFEIFSVFETRMNQSLVDMDAKIATVQTSVAECHAAVTCQTSAFTASISKLKEDFEANLNAQESRFELKIDACMAEFAKISPILKTEIAESSTALETSILQKVNADLAKIEESNLARFSTISAQISTVETRCDEKISEFSNLVPPTISGPSMESVSVEVGSMLSAELEKLEFESRLEKISSETDTKLNQIVDQFSTEFATFSKQLTTLSSSGHYYDWVIPGAMARLKSLGILSLPQSYISSEGFKIGPFRDFFFRFFPATATVWLVHKPSADGSEALLPLAVDLAVGGAKRGPIRMKKVQELFGHWVWEASFPQLAGPLLVGETTPDLKISVEISTRQWLVQEDTSQQDSPEVKSPMSSYTFFEENPFSEKRDLTPRRSSWAQFAPNPFGV